MRVICKESVIRTLTAFTLVILLASCATVRNWTQSPIELQVGQLLNELEEGQSSHWTSSRVQQELWKIGPPAVPALVTALQDKRPKTRLWAAKALSYVGSEASREVVPPLIVALDDEHSGVRHNAVWSLALMSAEPELSIPALVKVLKDERDSPGDALAGLRRHADHAHIAIPGLMETLQSESPAERRGAVLALGVLGRQPETVVPGLINALHDEDSSVRAAAAHSFYTFGSKAQGAVPALIPLLRDDNRQVRDAAINALGSLSEHLEETGAARNTRTDVIAVLVQTMNEDRETRADAARALASIGAEAVPFLIGALSAADPEVRSCAAMAFRYMDRLPDMAVSHLVEALSDKESVVPWQAAITLAQKERENDKVIPLLTDLLRQKELADKHLRQGAVHALRELDSDGVPGLIYALFDPARNVRYAAVIELSHVGENDVNVVPAVIALVLRQDARYIRSRALQTLESLFLHSSRDAPVRERTQEVISVLSSILQNDPEVRVRAADTLCAMYYSPGRLNRKNLNAVVLAFIDALASDDIGVRRLAASRLPTMRLNPDLPPERLEEALWILKAAMHDRDRNVRWAAAVTRAEVPGEFDSVAPVLWRALRDNRHADRRVQTSVAATLTTLGPDPVRAARIALRSRWADVRSVGVSALGRIHKGQKVVAIIDRALEDSASTVRRGAIVNVHKWVTEHEALISLYLKGLNDTCEDVRAIAAEGLLNRETGPDMLAVFGRALDDSSPRVRITAVTALRRCDAPRGALMPLYKKALADSNEEVRAQAGYGLKEMKKRAE